METGLKEKIIKLRKEGKSYGQISSELNCSKSTISFHCKNEALNDIGLDQSKKMSSDEIEDLKEFYKNNTLEENSKKFGVSTKTVKKYTEKKRFTYESDDEKRKSNYKRVKSFRNRTKEKAVEYKGGKCVICGYNRCSSALDFHHIDPSSKDFVISQYSNRSWDIVVNELDKCILVCSNCHREIHAGFINVPLTGLEPAKPSF